MSIERPWRPIPFDPARVTLERPPIPSGQRARRPEPERRASESRFALAMRREVERCDSAARAAAAMPAAGAGIEPRAANPLTPVATARLAARFAPQACRFVPPREVACVAVTGRNDVGAMEFELGGGDGSRCCLVLEPMPGGWRLRVVVPREGRDRDWSVALLQTVSALQARFERAGLGAITEVLGPVDRPGYSAMSTSRGLGTARPG